MEAEVDKLEARVDAPAAKQRLRRLSPPSGIRKIGNTRQANLIVLLVVLLALSILVSISLGAVPIPPRSLFSAALQRRPLSEAQSTILFAIRLPRIFASAIVGAALSLSGLMFQGLFRNPLADPYIIGASGGAAIGACIGLLFFARLSIVGFSATAIFAFFGALLTMAVVYTLARSRGRTSGVTLLLAGFAVGTMLINSTYIFEVLDPNQTFGHRIIAAWLHGAIGVPEWRQLFSACSFLFVAIVASYPLMRKLNTLALGDEYATQLGIRVEAARVAIIVTGSLLTALAVALGGLISFVGLIVPHIVRLLMGPDHTRLLPVTLLSGAIFLVLADTLARTLFAPIEFPVGVLMVFIGGPFFLYLLKRGKREYML